MILLQLTTTDIREWQDQSACIGKAEIFYNYHRIDQAKKICQECLVRVPCLDYALSHMDGLDDGDFLVWGGTTMKERVRMRNAMRREMMASGIPIQRISKPRPNVVRHAERPQPTDLVA